LKTLGRTAVAFAAFAAAACTAAAVAPAAQAWEYTVVNGRAGAVTVPQVFPFEDARFTTYGPYLTLKTFDAPFVHRSPATTGRQDVAAIYLVQRWNGRAWYEVTRQNTPMYSIHAGQRGVWLPKLYRSPHRNHVRGHLRVSWLVAWSTPAGADLGSVIINPSLNTDFRCAQMLRPCAASNRWVRLGRMFALGGGW
jgi:hypothetical protein